MRVRVLTLTAMSVLLAIAGCGSEENDAAGSTASTDDDTTIVARSTTQGDAPSSSAQADPLAVVSGEAFPTERCEANRAAGTVTFVTGFDFAAASSIVEVLVADDAGYYDDLCLDVEILPGFSSANYPLVASATAQFASGGSFSEVVNFANANDETFLVTSVDGRSAIDTLIVPLAKADDGAPQELAGLDGAVIGVKGKLPTSIEVMLRDAGLVEGENFDTVLLEGFDPLTHIEQPIDALPGWKSNEVGTLQREGVGVALFDPLDFGVPGSFGAIFTSETFAAEHPTAATDFARATARGLSDAVSDPAAAAAVAVEAITAGGNPNFLSPEGETFRWETEAELIMDGTPEGVGIGTPDVVGLQEELDVYRQAGLFGPDATPLDATAYIGSDVIADVYDADGTVIWPA